MQNWPNQRGKYRSLMMIKACDRSDLSRLELSGGKKKSARTLVNVMILMNKIWDNYSHYKCVRMHMPCSFPRFSAANSNYPKLEACFWPHLCFMEACICTMNFRHARIPRGLKKFEERRAPRVVYEASSCCLHSFVRDGRGNFPEMGASRAQRRSIIGPTDYMTHWRKCWCLYPGIKT